jgi:hypothetical protein
VNERVEKLVEKYCTHKFVIDGGKVCASREQLRAAIVEARREALKEAADYAESPETWKKLIQKDRTWGNITVAGKAIAEMIRELAGEERTK